MIGYLLGTILGGMIAWLIFITVGWRVCDWIGARWPGWEMLR